MVESVKLDAKARNEYHFLFNRYPDFILKAMKEGEQKGIEKGIEKGREEGIEKGSYTKAIETARNLIEMGLSRKDIVKATGLPMEEIAKL